MLDYWFLFPVGIALVLMAFAERPKLKAWWEKVRSTKTKAPALSDVDKLEQLATSIWNRHMQPALLDVRQEVMTRANTAVTVAREAHRLAVASDPAPEMAPLSFDLIEQKRAELKIQADAIAAKLAKLQEFESLLREK